MIEPVRLVIWDLDETFWRGTLTEGGVDESRHFCHVVEALAKRGIISSICSKNDFADAKAVLERLGAWQWFVFPSISWAPKGPRVRQIIEQAQLRAATVMFIDDNPMNLAEAQHLIPDLQVKDETFVAQILDDPLFVGKNDETMKRLSNYRLLEKKGEAQLHFDDDTHAFLRSSHITIEICYDLTENADRAIELVNRTNQLNFTKLRFSDNIDDARREFAALTDTSLFAHTGLVRVRDDYGDYGLVGFFSQVSHSTENRLIHFCFSCRTLGMFIETWLYRALGRPDITITGDVLTDLYDEKNPVDWITWYEAPDDREPEAAIYDKASILVCGGCDMDSVQHYISQATDKFTIFTNTVRHNNEIRRDHSSMIRRSIETVSDEEMRLLREIGYINDDLATGLKDVTEGFVVFSFWADIYYATYEIVGTGSYVAYTPNPFNYQNIEYEYEQTIRERNPSEEVIAQFRAAKANLRFRGKPDEQIFKDNLRAIFSALPAGVKIFLISAATKFPDPHPEWNLIDRHKKFNDYQNAVASEFVNVFVVDYDQFIIESGDSLSSTHFSRIVYQRLGLHLRDTFLTDMRRRGTETTGHDALREKIALLEQENARLRQKLTEAVIG